MSENPFADLGFKDPELEKKKAELVLQLGQAIAELSLSMADARKVIGLSEAELTELLKGNWQSFSVEQLKYMMGELRP